MSDYHQPCQCGPHEHCEICNPSFFIKKGPSPQSSNGRGDLQRLGMCCLLSGPGRGDCEHFVGLHGQPTDEYGKPDGWCWPCWKSYIIKSYERVLMDIAHGIGSTHAANKAADALAVYRDGEPEKVI